MPQMRKCKKCGIYTFSEVCPKCGAPTVIPHPPKFSPEDKFWKYRLRLRGVEI